MDATHLHCGRCTATQPIRFEALLPGEPALGTNVYCGRCRHLAFTLLRPARFYCEPCDQVQPALLERMELGPPGQLCVLLSCGVCFSGKAILYAALERKRGRRENPDVSRY
ncbi:MAG TPA: hypothetical protein VM489_13555 [Burkholderiales bacterium]|nr:hypothetical protein [Burkholderiales bacterium]